MVDVIERVRGSMLGLAIGDAIGHPTEFISSVERIRSKYGDKGVTGFEPSGMHKAGTFTDDTQMTISVARALIRKGHGSLDELMTLMGQEFVAWAEHPSNNRAPGGTCLAGCRKLKNGSAWRDAGVKESKGCGAAMRAAPIGWYFFDDDDALVRVAAAQSVLTHSHPTGIASSVAAAAPVAWILKAAAGLRAAGASPLDGIVAYTRAMVEKITPEMLRDLKAKEGDIVSMGIQEQLQALDDVQRALADDADDVCELLGGAWVGEEAVACALWCVLQAGGELKESVLRGANSSGDSDSIACIAGSIAGALGGVAGIPAEWVQGVERSSDLDALARAVWEAKSSGQDTPSLAGALDFFDAERPRAASKAPTERGTANDALDSTHDDGAVADDADDEDTEPHPVASLERLPDLDALSVTDLEALVGRHNRLYWELAAPVLTDVDFDKICRALSKRKPDSYALKHLGARPDAFSAVKHREPMLSLDKCYDEGDLEKWATGLGVADVLAMPKIDGLACSLRYDASGNLEVAATRGDGEEGEDITPNAHAVGNIPSNIEHAGGLEVRGEVYMSLRSFEKRRVEAAKAGDSVANPRNLAAGALRQKDPNNTRRAELAFLAYDVRGAGIDRQRDKMALVKKLGFDAIDVVVVPAAKAVDAVRELAAKRATLGYETDGVVLMADDVAAQARLGATAHHPRWALAWKFQGEEGQSVLRGIE
ncbi:MAG TPA: ADP-ribosylglycohydrolase family protein, partial [Myxococcota bacterium]